MSEKFRLNFAALKTVIIYFIIGVLWILFSDSILNSLVKDKSILTEIQTLKGWFFVIVTSLLLYFLIKRYAKQIRDSINEKTRLEKYLDFFTKYAHDIILVLDSEGNILESNEKAVESYGYRKDDLLKLRYMDLSFNKNELFTKSELEKIRREGGILYESIHVRKKGSTFPVEVSSKMIEHDNRIYYQCIIRDITERKESEERIRKLSTAVEQSPSSILITDTKGNIEYVNPSFSRLTGYEPNAVLGKNPSIMKSGKTPPETYKNLWDTISAGNEWRGEILNKKKDGSHYWEYTLISPLRDQYNKITHFIAIKEDITLQKVMNEELIMAKEKAEESDRLKSEFLAQMSHEIRTPLNAVLSFNNLLKDELQEQVNEDMKISFDSIDNAGKRLLRTLNHILNMAAFQTGNFELSFSTFNVSDVIAHFLNEFEYKASAKDLNLIYNKITEDTSLNCDEYIVSEILQNLIDNALKYTLHGSITIEIGRQTDSSLYVKIADTGIGISEEYLPKLFRPFSQEETGYSRRFEGNGLGLALVKNYVDLIGANIKVSSKKGEGSEFVVIFTDRAYKHTTLR